MFIIFGTYTLQGSAVTQTVLGGLTICLLVANFLVYMCQKLWKLAGSRQSYCKNYLAYFFGPPCILSLEAAVVPNTQQKYY